MRRGSEPAESLSSIDIPLAEQQPRYFRCLWRGVTTGIGYGYISRTDATPSKLEGIPNADYKRSRIAGT
jgi:hypothetical protein